MVRGYSVGKTTAASSPDTHHLGAGAVAGVIITTDGTNDVTVIIADDATELVTLKSAGADLMRTVPLPGDASFTTNLTVTVTGTGGTAYVFFRPH